MKLIRNLAYLSGAELASKVITFAAIAFLARLAGPQGYGYIEFASAVLLCAGLIVDQGFGPYGAREIAKAPEQTARLFSEIVLARSLLALAAVAVVILFALLTNRPPAVITLLLVYCLSLLLTPLLLQWVFQGHSQMGTAAVIGLLRQLLFAVVVFAFFRGEATLWVAALAETAGVAAGAAFGVWQYRRRFGRLFAAPAALSSRLFREGVPIGLSQMFWMIRMYGATVVMGLIAAPQDVGFFGGAMRILVALHAFIYLYYFNLLPALSQSWVRRDGSFEKLISNSLRLVAWAGVAAGLLWALLAPLGVRIVYGPAYAPAGVALQWMAGVAVVAAISGHYRYGLIAAGRQNLEMLTAIIGAVLALILIPLGYRLGGVSGVSAGLLVSEIAVWIFSWAFSRRLGLTGQASLLVRPAAALAISGALLLALPGASLPARILLALVPLGAVALLTDATVRSLLRQPWRAGRAAAARDALQ